LKQVGVALLFFSIALALKSLLASLVPFLSKLPMQEVQTVIAEEAARHVLGNVVNSAISRMTDMFG
jgi:hypothetical protein